MSNTRPEPVSPTILIATPSRIAAAEACLPAAQEGGLLTFTDADIQRAVETIVETRPSAVALERRFAASARGGALVNRIRLDPELRDIAIQVVVVGGTAEDVETLPPHAIIPSSAGRSEELPPADYRGTRHVRRTEFDLGVLLKVDGDPATVVDMSPLGMQVLVVNPLRPYQRVRVVAAPSRPTLRCEATVVWAHYELHDGPGGYYRAGLSFVDADPDAVAAFCAEWGTTAAVA